MKTARSIKPTQLRAVAPRRGPGRPRGKAPRTAGGQRIVVRSEGQRLLLEVDASTNQIAAACSVTRPAVIDWRYGRSTPSAPARAELWAAYEIPAPSWGLLPAGKRTGRDGVSGPSAATHAPTARVHAPEVADGNGHAHAAHVPGNALDETAALLVQIRRQLERTDMLASERARVTDAYTKTLALQHRLQKEADLTDDRIIREHPSWQRIRAELVRVLAPYPSVASEVCEALDRIGM